MLRTTSGWVATVMIVTGLLLIGAAGCQDKETAPAGGASTAEETAQAATTKPDPVLDAMRRQATMPAKSGGQPQQGSQAGAQDMNQGNPLFPKELFNAAQAGDLDKVKRIMQSGRPVMVIDEQGSTPVHYAAAGGQVKVLEYLFGLKGFGPNEVNQMKVTPLHWAAVTGHRNTVDFLVSKGAKIDAVDDQGRTPLFAAATAGRTDVVDYLIQKGANINAKDSGGKTVLDAATTQLNVPGIRDEFAQALGEVVKMLTDHGAKEGPPPGQGSQTKPAGR